MSTTTLPFDRRGFYLALAKRIRLARKAKGMTQVDLAVRAGLAACTLSQLETARMCTTINTVLLIAEVLEVHPQALLFGPEE